MISIASEKVLIVDDSPLSRQIMSKMLSDLGVEVLTAESGAEALEMFQKHDLAIIVMDVMMNDMDGFAAARKIRHLEHPNSHVPIIFVTATLGDTDHVFKGYDSGAVDYLLKPVDSKPLQSKVQVFCELHAQRRVIDRKNRELQKHIDEIETLRGLIPICASCKSVRDDAGFWQSIEGYFAEHSTTRLSHSICPDCAERLYPDVASENRESN